MANKQFLDKDGADYLVQGLKAKIPTKVSELTNDSGFKTTDNDTKNTAGSTDTSSKIFLVGATSQAANPQTYSHDTAYVGTDGCLYSNGKKVLTDHQSLSSLVPDTRTVNGKALSSDISLTASDVGALPSDTVIPTVNNAILTIQKNGTTVKTFTANASDNVTANITVPTKVSELTNDSGYKTTDNNTTYSLTQDATNGHKITLTPSTGTAKTITIPDNNTTYTFATGDNNGQIKVTPNDGVAQNISVKGLGSLAYSSATIPTKTSELTNDSNFSTFSGNYNDLTNKPTIPTDYVPNTRKVNYKALSGDIVLNAMDVNAIPVNFGTEATTGSGGQYVNGVNYGGTLYNGILKSIPILNLSGDLFYRCYERGATATSTYDNVVNKLGESYFDGSYSNYQTKINPSTDFISKPFVIEMTCTTSFEMTDVTRLYLVAHRFANVSAKKYKIEVAYAYSNGTFSWATAYEYNSTVSQVITNKFYGLYCSSSGMANWHSIFGIRITISESTDTVFQLAEIMLINNRGTELPFRSLHAFGDVGGTLYGGITPYKNNSYNLGTSTNKWNNIYATTFNGNATSATKATQDGDGNVIKDTYYKASNPNGYTSNTGTVTSVTLGATGPITIDNSAAITTSGSRTISHSNSGVTAGTYKSVTVNATGHVTAGTNPTTLSGYGITDAKIADGVITLGSNTITPLTAHQDISGKVNKSGDTMTGKLTVPQVETGADDSSYFQTRKIRGEGNASTYYHAVDFGYAGHDAVDFYEYGGVYNFWKNTSSSKTTTDDNLCLGITSTGLKNKGNTYTFPQKDGTFALTSDIPDITGKQDKITSTNKLSYDLVSGTPTIPTITDTYSSTSSDGMSGKAVASAISGKQNTLTTQTAYSAKGSATKVPQITTNTLGQVTGITEVTITQPTVNNATLTIQKNGTNVATFGANASSDVTANITVPTVTDTYSATSSNGMSGKAVASAISGKQDALVSGTSIKTINNQSLLGSGNITINDWGSDDGWHNITLASGISVGSIGGTPQYKKIGKHVFIRGSYAGTKASGTLVLATLPEGYRPTYGTVYDFNAMGGTRVARTFINTDGEISFEWAWTFASNPSAWTGNFSWLDVEMDFWID